MAPTRCGDISVANVLSYMTKNNLGPKDMKELLSRKGGFVNHLGISDAIELTNRAANGDKYAEMLWNTMIYQIEKGIGAMAAALHGKVDGILLGGGMVHNKDLVASIEENCGWIAPVSAYPGEFELEAMAAGAIRVLDALAYSRGRETRDVAARAGLSVGETSAVLGMLELEEAVARADDGWIRCRAAR